MTNKKSNNLPVAVFSETELSFNFSAQELNSSIRELNKEAARLFKILDDNSHAIINLEKSLQALSANFPFRMLIKENAESFPKAPEDYHKARAGITIIKYCTKVCWFLSWDYDEKANKFRLLTIAEENEIIYYNEFYDIKSDIFQSKYIFKKPLIETNIQTRLDYFKHLPEFIEKFKKYLQNMRECIESGLPF
jgi:hypothetical protein